MRPAGPSLSDQAGFLVIGQSLARLGRLLGGILLVNLLSHTQYADYGKAWVIFQLGEALFALGLGDGVYYYLPALRAEDRGRFLWRTVGAGLILGLIYALLLWAGTDLAARQMGAPELRRLLPVFALYAVFQLPAWFFNPALICLGRAGLSAWLAVVFMLGETVAIVAPVALGLGLRAIFAALVLFAAAKLAAMLLIARRVLAAAPPPTHPSLCVRKGTHPPRELPSLATQLAFCLPLGLSRFAQSVYRYVDQWFIALWYGHHDFSLFYNGARQVPMVGTVAASAYTVAQPHLVRHFQQGDRAALLDLWHRVMRKTSLVLFPVTGLLLMTGDELYALAFPASYLASASVFKVYLLMLPTQVLVFTNIMVALGLSRWVLRQVLIEMVFNLSYNTAAVFLLRDWLGITGPAIATVCSWFTGIAITTPVIRRALACPWADLLPWRGLARIALATAAGMAAIMGLRTMLSAPLLYLALAAPLFLAIYLAAIHIVRAWDADDRAMFYRWLTLRALRERAG